MTKHEWYRDYTRLEKALGFATRRLLGYTRALHADGAESEAFQCYQLIEELATLADKEWDID
jgi:hypothetical protein